MMGARKRASRTATRVRPARGRTYWKDRGPARGEAARLRQGGHRAGPPGGFATQQDCAATSAHSWPAGSGSRGGSARVGPASAAGSAAYPRPSLLAAVWQFRLAGNTHIEILQQAVAQGIDPTVDRQGLSARPGVTHDGRLTDVDNLLDDVEFTEATVALGLGLQC